VGAQGLNRVLKKVSKFILSRLGVGVLAVAPIYLAALLLVKVMKSCTAVVRPVVKLLPKWLPAEHLLSFLLVLLVCFLIGLMVRTPAGRARWGRMESSLLQGIPGYALFRSLIQQLAGKTQDQAWKPALAEIEEALVPAFIIEEHEDGRFTVFVPSVPTPFAGAIYILSPDRVHPLDVPFTQAIKAVSHWGSGSKVLVAAMETKKTPFNRETHDDVGPRQGQMAS
jgi:uncharacterized membrane protein